MTTRFNCALDGVSMAGLDDRMCILDIREDAPKLRVTTFPLPGGGQKINQVRESLTLRVTFAIQEENPTLRKQALQAVLAWAMKGGVLTTSDRTGQQLTVACTGLPDIACEDWSEPLTLAFTTTHCPYWEAASATSIVATGSTAYTVPGTADNTPVTAVITNTSTETVTRLSIHCGASCMIFEDILLPAGSMFYLQTIDGVLSARIDGESVLACRTPGSSDLLLAPCGKSCIVNAMALQPLKATYTARGRYV